MSAILRKLLLLDALAQFDLRALLNPIFGIPEAAVYRMGRSRGYTISAALGANIADAPRACWFCKAVLAVVFWNIDHCEDAAGREGLATVTTTVTLTSPGDTDGPITA